MNLHDSERRMREAFGARLDAAPTPPDTMLARTRAAIEIQPARWAPPKPPEWPAPARRASRGPNMFASVAQFAAATAIVVVCGTLALGSVRLEPQPTTVATRTRTSEVTFEQSMPAVGTVVRSGSMSLAVDDVARTVQRIGAIAARENAVVTRIEAGRAVAAVRAVRVRGGVRGRALHVVLRVPAERLGATMREIGTLGAVATQTVAARDLSAAIATNARRLLRARDRERELEAAGVPPRRAAALSDAARLNAIEDRLDTSVAGATLAVIITPAAHAGAAPELSNGFVRPTATSLARGSWNAAQVPLHTGNRARALAAVASSAAAVGSGPNGAGTGRDDPANRA